MTQPAVTVCMVGLLPLDVHSFEKVFGVFQMSGTCQRQLRSGYAAKLAYWAAVWRSESPSAIPQQ